MVTAQFWKFPINRPNHLNVVVFDKLQILLFVFLAIDREVRVELLVQLALLVLLPMAQLKVVYIFITKQPHYLQQQLEESQD